MGLGRNDIINRSEVMSILGISDRTLSRRVREVGFPQPIEVGKRTRVWVRSEVEEYAKTHHRRAPRKKRVTDLDIIKNMLRSTGAL